MADGAGDDDDALLARAIADAVDKGLPLPPRGNFGASSCARLVANRNKIQFLLGRCWQRRGARAGAARGGVPAGSLRARGAPRTAATGVCALQRALLVNACLPQNTLVVWPRCHAPDGHGRGRGGPRGRGGGVGGCVTAGPAQPARAGTAGWRRARPGACPFENFVSKFFVSRSACFAIWRACVGFFFGWFGCAPAPGTLPPLRRGWATRHQHAGPRRWSACLFVFAGSTTLPKCCPTRDRCGFHPYVCYTLRVLAAPCMSVLCPGRPAPPGAHADLRPELKPGVSQASSFFFFLFVLFLGGRRRRRAQRTGAGAPGRCAGA